MPDHLERGRDILQHLGHILAEPAHRTPAIGADAGRFVNLFLARQMRRQGTPRRPFDKRLHGGRMLGGANAIVLVQLIELKLKLLDLARQFLRGLPELQPLQFGDAGFQLGDLQALCLHRACKCGCVRWQVGEVDVHAGDNSAPALICSCALSRESTGR